MLSCRWQRIDCAIPHDPNLYIGALGAAGKMMEYAKVPRNGAEVYGGVRNMRKFRESLGNHGFTHTGRSPEAARMNHLRVRRSVLRMYIWAMSANLGTLNLRIPPHTYGTSDWQTGRLRMRKVYPPRTLRLRTFLTCLILPDAGGTSVLPSPPHPPGTPGVFAGSSGVIRDMPRRYAELPRNDAAG